MGRPVIPGALMLIGLPVAAFLFVAGLALSAVAWKRGDTCHLCRQLRTIEVRRVRAGITEIIEVDCPRCRPVRSQT